nr:ARID DNA-binding domain-containing protein [Tanacetum cinerariifolium]
MGIVKKRHVGEEKVQEAWLQSLMIGFQTLQMKYDDTMDAFTAKLNGYATKAKELGKYLDESVLVRKLLDSTPDRNKHDSKEKGSTYKEKSNTKWNKRAWDMSKIQCHKCGKLGHFRKNCKESSTTQEQSNLILEDDEPSLLMATHKTEHEEVLLNEGQIQPRKYATAPYSPQQNGVVERKNRTVLSTTRSMMKAMKLSLTFWAEADWDTDGYDTNIQDTFWTSFMVEGVDNKNATPVNTKINDNITYQEDDLITHPDSPVTPPAYTYNPNSKKEEEATISSLRNSEDRFDGTPVRDDLIITGTPRKKLDVFKSQMEDKFEMRRDYHQANRIQNDFNEDIQFVNDCKESAVLAMESYTIYELGSSTGVDTKLEHLWSYLQESLYEALNLRFMTSSYRYEMFMGFCEMVGIHLHRLIKKFVDETFYLEMTVRRHFANACPQDDTKTTQKQEKETAATIPSLPEPKVSIKYPEFIYFRTRGIIDGTDKGSWDDFWHISNTSNNHMTANLKFFLNIKEEFAVEPLEEHGKFLFTYGIGEVLIENGDRIYTIQGVHYAPEVTLNILSIGLLRQQGFEISSNGDRCTLAYMFKDRQGKNINLDRIREQHNNYLEDYFDALDRSAKIERRIEQPYEKKDDDEKGRVEHFEITLEKEEEGKCDATAHQDEEDMAMIKCYLCQKTGHFDFECPNDDQRPTNGASTSRQQGEKDTHSSSSDDFTIIV